MAFSAIMGLAGSALGAIGSMSAAKKQAEAAMYDASLRRQTEQEMAQLANVQMGIGTDMLRREGELYNYTLDQNAYNRRAALEQQNYGRNIVESDRAMALAERDMQIDRVRQLDSQAAQEYQRQLAAIQTNTRVTASERNYAIQQLERAQAIASQERQMQMRMLEQDRARIQDEREQALSYLDYNRNTAASERAYDIEQQALGRRTATSERAQALDFLNEAKRTAASERASDEARFNRNSSQLANERAFQETEYRNQRAIAMQERLDSLSRRNQLDEATGRYGQALEAALAQFGEMKPINYLGEADIAAEAGRRERVAVEDIEQMADRVASINEANLIRKGVDQSTRATDERGQITARMANEMAKARDAARSEGVKYISGINDQLRLGDEMEKLRRQAALAEVAQTHGVPLEALMRAPELQSALGGPSFNQVGSAVYDRNIVSANDYSSPLSVGTANFSQSIGSAGDYAAPMSVGSGTYYRDVDSANGYNAPVSIGSGIYDRAAQNLGYGMADFTNFQSGIGPSAYGGSAVYNFSMPSISSASSMFQGASSGMGNVLSSRGQQANASAAAAGQAAYGAGQAFTSFAKDLGGFLDGAFAKKPSFAPLGSGGGFRAEDPSWLKSFSSPATVDPWKLGI